LRCTKIFIAALCLVVLTASAAFCIDPYRVNEGGFGPKIKGLQLGQKFWGLDAVSWMLRNSKLPFTLSFSTNNSRLIDIEFSGKSADDFSFKILQEISENPLKPKNLGLDELMAVIDDEGFIVVDRNRWPFITLDANNRITNIWLSKADFEAEAMTSKEFVQAVVDAYNIPSVKNNGKNQWQHTNVSQGWQITIDVGRGKDDLVFIEPIITNAAFD